jgi:hypothetical protein
MYAFFPLVFFLDKIPRWTSLSIIYYISYYLSNYSWLFSLWLFWFNKSNLFPLYPFLSKFVSSKIKWKQMKYFGYKRGHKSSIDFIK